MKIQNKKLLDDFVRKHGDTRKSVQRWLDISEYADIKDHNQLKEIFPDADYVGNGRYVFNIKGNRYRFVVLVVFVMGVMYIRFCGTHAEYDKIKNIENI